VTTTAPTDATTADPEQFVGWAHELGAQFEEFNVGHDRDGTFVSEAFAILKESGYLTLAVPTELGGKGATIRQVAYAQLEMAKHCPSTALAITMHHHIVLFAAWRYRREMPGAEAQLRAVADGGILFVSTGGADFTRPNGTAVKVDGGYEVSGRKIFCSQVPAGDVLSTLFTFDDPEQGRRVLGTGVPIAADGVTIIENWDAMGMRGTGSNDVDISGVFVSDAQIASNRPWGVLDPPFMAILCHAIPPVSAVYLGVAERARDRVLEMIAGTTKAENPTTQRLVGLLDYRLRVARWALDGALRELGDNPEPTPANVVAALQAKRAVAQEAVAAADLAMEAIGGAAYFRKVGIEQAVRDVRGVMFHPLTPELTLLHAGKVALGVPAEEW
jgi:alkylation response protein AidB-like acyl-CoA dehydrogenase